MRRLGCFLVGKVGRVGGFWLVAGFFTEFKEFKEFKEFMEFKDCLYPPYLPCSFSPLSSFLHFFCQNSLQFRKNFVTL